MGVASRLIGFDVHPTPRAGRQRLHAARTREGVRDGEHARAAVVNATGADRSFPERTPALRASTTARKRVCHTSSLSLPRIQVHPPRKEKEAEKGKEKEKEKEKQKAKLKRLAQGEVHQCHKRRCVGTAKGF